MTRDAGDKPMRTAKRHRQHSARPEAWRQPLAGSPYFAAASAALWALQPHRERAANAALLADRHEAAAVAAIVAVGSQLAVDGGEAAARGAIVVALEGQERGGVKK